MTDPTPRKFDDGDEAYERDKDKRVEAAGKLSWTQVAAAVEVAEAEYDRELGWDAQRAAEKMLDTDDPAAFKTAREMVKTCQLQSDRRAKRFYAAVAKWREVRPKP